MKQEVTVEKKESWVGGVSYYSHDGCVGCHPQQIMANGVKFDENADTLAFNWLPLNTKVKVINLETGQEEIATVTDRHGAYKEKYNWRIADLSKGLAQKLGVKTDRTKVRIEEI